jgi:glycosyltransferase involved in cell wall biosynthesis
MTGTAATSERFDALKACVIIPTYNNAATLGKLIEDVSAYTKHIIVVNDGSTDNTLEILQNYPAVQLVTYPNNVGKGWALRKAFKYAVEKGYAYAITIDSDGQHFAKDLPVFITALEAYPNAIIIGARNMDQSTVPGGSSFGNKFSNFWFKVETGITSPDTQSGYRLYPLLPLQKMRFTTFKYEFEIEVLVKAAWKGIDVISVPVTVYYAPKEERVSHFRPFKDFFRISVLNTVLVLISLLYIKPRDILLTLFSRKKMNKLLDEHLFNPHHSAQLKAMSVAFGIFMGIVPIWGFQLAVAIFLAIVFKLNKPLVIVAANISIPPMIPLIIFLSYKTGALWLGDAAMEIDFSNALTLSSIKQNLIQYVIGSITLAIVAAIVFGLLTFIFLKLIEKKQAVTTRAE